MNISNGFLTTTGLILVQILYVLTQNCYRGYIYFDNDDVYCEGAASINVLNQVQSKGSVFYLKFINCNFRNIDSNSLYGFTGLKMLLMDGSGILQIEPYTFNNLKYLYSLKLSRNLLTEIPDKAFNGSSNIETLDLSYNKLTHISFKLFVEIKNLTYLDLSHNRIISSSGNLTSSRLETIKLSGNQIKRISFQFETPMLKHLSLDSLQLTAFSFDLLKNSKNLTTLDLSWNQITSINGTATLQKLISFTLIENKIENLFFKVSAANLLNIDLNHQNLKQFDLNLIENMTSLQILNASSNSITQISGPSLIPFIGKIDFSNNSISSITNVTFNTTELHLEHNEIAHIVNSQPIFNALTLHLENNKISSIAIGAFRYLNKLQYLNLSHNMITDLQMGTFTGLNELTSLDLSHNNIKEMKYTSIQVFSKLRYLNIASNKLTDIDYSLSLLQSLDTISANNNSFNCFTLHRILKHLLEREKIQIIENNEHFRTNIFGIHCIEESTIANDKNYEYSKKLNFESPKETHVNTNKIEISPQHMDAINKIHGIYVTLIALVVLLIIFVVVKIIKKKLFSHFRIYYSKRESESGNIEFM